MSAVVSQAEKAVQFQALHRRHGAFVIPIRGMQDRRAYWRRSVSRRSPPAAGPLPLRLAFMEA
jgi:hypothetical protein